MGLLELAARTIGSYPLPLHKTGIGNYGRDIGKSG